MRTREIIYKEAEIFGAYKGERWALLMKKSKPNFDK